VGCPSQREELLDPASRDWANQKGYVVPYKPPLLVKLKRRTVTDSL